MGVARLHLQPMAPGIRSANALAGLDLGLYVRRNFRSRGALTLADLVSETCCPMLNHFLLVECFSCGEVSQEARGVAC